MRGCIELSVNALIKGGLTAYPDIVDRYIEVQRTLVGSILPPLRFLLHLSLIFGTSHSERKRSGRCAPGCLVF